LSLQLPGYVSAAFGFCYLRTYFYILPGLLGKQVEATVFRFWTFLGFKTVVVGNGSAITAVITRIA
jgi:hypothetical protein